MRRKDKEMGDRALIDSVISRCQVCRIGLCDEGLPYIVPMCFGYEGNTLYLHSAGQGRKIDILKRNSTVFFELDTDCELKKGDKPCSFTMKYRSVMGYGKATFIDDIDAKRRAFGIIMKHYDEGTFTFPDEALDKIAMIMIEIMEITGKKSGY
ncbi:MAG TPA: pyridoxamine 5'-phosphate oxidase family protein [Desulfomonilia bacterium]|nr:pyridoxamine 5'-phosphate oxidase family protein [Desulfomonilia bacterium]